MKILLSGIQPSGALHIGNYLGAIKQWVDLQKDYRVFAMIADLHAITVPQEPEELHKKTLEVAALLVACGIDPEKSVIFVQSHVPAHAELAWVLNTITPLGELEGMHQFQEKGKIKQKDIKALKEAVGKEDIVLKSRRPIEISGIESTLKIGFKIVHEYEKTRETPAGLLYYPVLMAADILLYQTEAVPVGEDQQQHLELTRTLANKFNNRFGETFRVPQAIILKNTGRVMGLDDPAKKMSKSASSANNYIALLDAPDEIRRKVKIAVTDSGKEVKYDEEQKPAIANLMRIYSAFSGLSMADIEKENTGKTYAIFKNDLAELLVSKLDPLQSRYRELADDENVLRSMLKNGAEQAHEIAKKTLETAYAKVGFVGF